MHLECAGEGKESEQATQSTLIGRSTGPAGAHAITETIEQATYTLCTLPTMFAYELAVSVTFNTERLSCLAHHWIMSGCAAAAPNLAASTGMAYRRSHLR